MCNSEHEKISSKNDGTFEKEDSQKFVLQVKHLAQYCISIIIKIVDVSKFCHTCKTKSNTVK